MSNFAWGYIEYEGSVLELSFYAHRCALDNGFAIMTGFNAKYNSMIAYYKDSEFLNNSETKKILPFEVITNPIEDQAHDLLIGDGVISTFNGKRTETGEGLISRMLRIQKFLQACLDYKTTKCIGIYFNVEPNDNYQSFEISPNDFVQRIVALYKESNNITPEVKFTVTKSN